MELTLNDTSIGLPEGDPHQPQFPLQIVSMRGITWWDSPCRSEPPVALKLLCVKPDEAQLEGAGGVPEGGEGLRGFPELQGQLAAWQPLELQCAARSAADVSVGPALAFVPPRDDLPIWAKNTRPFFR